jgi:hypothetical protein
VEQYNVDVIDDKEAPYDALQRMTIGGVRLQDQVNLKPQMILLHPHKIMIKDKKDEHENEQEESQHEDQVHDQEEIIDQGGDKDDGNHEGSRTRPPHPRVHQTVQRDHFVDNILGDIKKG